MAKDRFHDREIDELKSQIKRLEERELRFRRRQQRYEEDILRNKKKGIKDLILMVVFLSLMVRCKMKNSLIG